MNVEIGKELLKMIIEGWIKMSEFSFGGAWLKLKQRSKKSLQCSKGLRKVLITNNQEFMQHAFFSVIMIHSCLEIILCFAFSFSKSGLEL